MAQDSEVLLSIFPGEVWLHVFEKCAQKHFYDVIEAGINSSLYFRNLLNAKSTTLLFPKVIQVIGPMIDDECDETFTEDFENWQKGQTPLENDYEDPHENDPTDEESNQNRIRKRKSKPCKYSCLLKMRSVCKTWNYAVKSYYRNLDYHYRFDHDHLPVYADENSDRTPKHIFHHDDWSREVFICRYYKEPLEFIKRFDKTHSLETGTRNPFIGRSITIDGIDDSRPNSIAGLLSQEGYTFWNAITTLLEKYGKHIWYCNLTIFDQFSSRIEYYGRIKEWLNLMPNLKVLDFFSSQLSDYESLTKKDLKKLEKEARKNPLNKMKDLTFLRTYNLHAQIFNEILKTNLESIDSLEIRQSNNLLEGYDFTVPMPRLNKLHIDVLGVDEAKKVFNSAANWNLDTFYLNYDRFAQFTEWSEIFKLFEQKWTKKITNLMINIRNAMGEEENLKLKRELMSANLKLDLPNVKRFKFNRPIEMPIDFMLSMKNTLEIFEVNFSAAILGYGDDEETITCDEEQSAKDNYRIKIFEEEMYESNIWELFPKLEKIHVWFDMDPNVPRNDENVKVVYTRDVWKQFQDESE